MMRSVLAFAVVALLAHGVAHRAVRSTRAAPPPKNEEARALDRVLPRAVDRIAPSLLRVRPEGDEGTVERRTRTAVALAEDFAVMDAVSIGATGVDDLVLVDAKGKVHKAKIRGRDSRLRLVALEVEGGGLVPAPRATRLPATGTFVVSVGAVYGDKPNATFGIVSATGRFEGRALQVDCGIDPANAGGALVDLEGNFVGVPVLVDRKLGDDSGVGFVVPVSRIESVIERLRKGDDLQPGYMGVALPQDEPEISPSLEGGVKIEGVQAEGPAKKAGLEVSDVIVEIEGQKIKSLRGLLAVLSDKAAGDTIKLTVLRAGKEQSFTLTLVGR